MCCQFLVSGRVQGVFFRASAARVAQAQQLRGHAVNLRDGRVEVIACGSAPACAAMREFLRTGPPAARVDKVSESPHACVSTPFVTG